MSNKSIIAPEWITQGSRMRNANVNAAAAPANAAPFPASGDSPSLNMPGIFSAALKWIKHKRLFSHFLLCWRMASHEVVDLTSATPSCAACGRASFQLFGLAVGGGQH